jgi:spermidine/putrescine transport system substrate-binding protein
MKTLLGATIAVAGLAVASTAAKADGELFIYNWTDYTSPELIEKFEKETGISVTLDIYDSSETLLAKLQSGATGYDIIVPGHAFLPIMIEEGLVQEIDVASLKGHENLEERWRNPEWDPEGKYSVPWQWGTTSFMADTALYDGPIDTLETLFEPPPPYQGSIAMFRAPSEVIGLALIYLDKPQCNDNVEDMREVQELLLEQRPHVKIYNSDGILERLVAGDTAMHMIWNGYAMRAREQKPTLKYAMPKEGILGWMDVMAVPSGAKNRDNAIRFLEFMLQPENMAIQSNFARYANAVKGSQEFMDEDLRSAPELNVPEDVEVIFPWACGEESIRLYDRVWTRVLQ